MRVVVQRVAEAQVAVEGRLVADIGPGLLVLAGFRHEDTQADVDYIAGKLAKLRVFEDADGRMNLSVADMGGEILAIPNFTLYAQTLRGRRPSFDAAARTEVAEPLFTSFCQRLRETGLDVGAGEFGAHMHVSLVNDGPVTFILESEARLQGRGDT